MTLNDLFFYYSGDALVGFYEVNSERPLEEVDIKNFDKIQIDILMSLVQEKYKVCHVDSFWVLNESTLAVHCTV